MTRALLLSTYVKFVNLFPEIKGKIQEVFRQHSNLRSADAELQQRASEYLQLSVIASTDVLVSLLNRIGGQQSLIPCNLFKKLLF